MIRGGEGRRELLEMDGIQPILRTSGNLFRFISSNFCCLFLLEWLGLVPSLQLLIQTFMFVPSGKGVALV